MCENMDIQSSIASNSVSFLQNLSKQSSLQIPALKSFYLTKSRLIELNKTIKLPKQVNSGSGKCNKCLINFQIDTITCKVAKSKKTKFARKLLLKQRKHKVLTDFQRKYSKRCITNDNNLIITCKFCKKEKSIPMKKPIIKPIVVDTPVSKTATKKKKKKISRFSGLNEQLVLSAKKKQKDFVKLIPLKILQEKTVEQKKPCVNGSNLIPVNSKSPKKSRDSIKFKSIIVKEKPEQLNNNNGGKVTKKKNQALEKSLKNLKQLMASSTPLSKPKEKPANKLQAFLKGIELSKGK
ncbi:unnamed protein product [Brassicogethes aeneus]|uniref:Uncharacterized protein n=1 Tax=Brassicogethes aeneus TaxID=1431903 RepID=A0A9P0BBA0_BRAAE|nr:unnamed protein product [Brassicogethes aeneus]